MWKTALFLIFTLIIVPVIAFYHGEAPNEVQIQAMKTTAIVYLIASLLCFLVSLITKNHSQVDKLWSIIPIVYAWIIAYYGEFTPRMILMASLISLWGIRLTYNFHRRGGYSWKFWTGEEDYRWSVLQEKPEFKATWKWTLFNLFFISLYQMGLILLITFPMVKAIGGTGINTFDYILALIVLFLIIIETVADQQQWNFQKEKHLLLKKGDKLTGIYTKGFVHTGIWSIVRHPNYAAEQGIWIIIYFFSVSATGQWLNWSIMGCLLLIVLFRGSSDFSESISSEKYADYKRYKKEVGRFLPYFRFKK